MIDSFSGDFEFLSNFYIFSPAITVDYNYFDSIGLGKITVNSTEVAYQAGKSKNPKSFENFTPFEAKKFGRKTSMSEKEVLDWNNFKKLRLMERLLRLKFDNNHPDLQQKLIATYPEELVEGNYWKDEYWGVCDGIGENHLGKLLMQIRQELIVKSNTVL